MIDFFVFSRIKQTSGKPYRLIKKLIGKFLKKSCVRQIPSSPSSIVPWCSCGNHQPDSTA